MHTIILIPVEVRHLVSNYRERKGYTSEGKIGYIVIEIQGETSERIKQGREQKGWGKEGIWGRSTNTKGYLQAYMETCY